MSQPPPPGAGGPGRGDPSPPNMNMGMGGMAGGMGMGYHGYQIPPSFGFPPQGMQGAPPGAAMGGGMPMMGAPPDSYGAHGGGGAAGMGMGMGAISEKISGTHICTVHPPGMPRAFDVPFPERRLPVCDRCKKNFKSRDLCRKRDGHKALPWQTTYIAVTITESALEQLGEDDAPSMIFTYADIPMVAELQETPLMCLGPADGSMKLEPICKVCREKNYTRDYCRNTCKHTTPPWSTTYVKLVADKTPKDDGNKYKYPKRRKKQQEENADGKPKPDLTIDGENGIAIKEEENMSDDLSEIHKSKTFLAAISSKKMTVRWCERIQYPAASEEGDPDHNAPPPGAPGGSSMMPYMNNMANNPNMQHQNSQLWDAFRAGAMWAQSQGGQMPPGYGYPPGGMPPNPGGGPGGPAAFFSQPPGAGGAMPGGYPGPGGGGGGAGPGPGQAPPPVRRGSYGGGSVDNGNGGEGDDESISPNQGERV